MRVLLKIFIAPFVVILTISWAVMVFLFCWTETILKFLSGIALLISVVMLIAGQTPGGIAFGVIAFLISPVGLPVIAKWLVEKLGDLNATLKCFITS